MFDLKSLQQQFPLQGRVEWIGVRPERRSDLISLAQVIADPEKGLTDDHYRGRSGKRHITLIQAEHIHAVSSLLGKKLDPSEFRRNLVISGINLLALKNALFSIGQDCILRGTGNCHPCSRMEENLGHGGYNAMRGHGGITAQIIQGGLIKLKAGIQFSEI